MDVNLVPGPGQGKLVFVDASVVQLRNLIKIVLDSKLLQALRPHFSFFVIQDTCCTTEVFDDLIDFGKLFAEWVI